MAPFSPTPTLPASCRPMVDLKTSRQLTYLPDHLTPLGQSQSQKITVPPSAPRSRRRFGTGLASHSVLSTAGLAIIFFLAVVLWSTNTNTPKPRMIQISSTLQFALPGGGLTGHNTTAAFLRRAPGTSSTSTSTVFGNPDDVRDPDAVRTEPSGADASSTDTSTSTSTSSASASASSDPAPTSPPRAGARARAWGSRSSLRSLPGPGKPGETMPDLD